MQTEITIIIGAIITGLITLDKVGILDKIFKRNGKNNATKGDITTLKENDFHGVNEKLDRADRSHEKQVELLQEIFIILKSKL